MYFPFQKTAWNACHLGGLPFVEQFGWKNFCAIFLSLGVFFFGFYALKNIMKCLMTSVKVL